MAYVFRERISNLAGLKPFRRKLRRRMTPAEAKLWSHLKNSKCADFKFRRQHSIGPYILDFYCPSACLAIELDGAVHNSPMAVESDHKRTQFLALKNIRVLRFENKIVFEHPEWVLNEIKVALSKAS